MACINPRRYRVAEGEPAPVTIHANQTMDDEGATESLRQSAMNGVQPVYQIDQALVETLEQGASGFFDSLTDVRAKALQQAATEAPTQAEWKPTREVGFLLGWGNYAGSGPGGPVGGTDGHRSGELTMLREIVLPKITTALTGGLTESSLENVRTAAIAEVNAAASLSAGLKQTGELVLTEYLQPTYIVDEAATQAARQTAAQQVEPVQIKRGDVIVREGATVTSEQMALLTQMDMVEGGSNDTLIRVGLALYVLLAYALFACGLYALQPQTLQDLKRLLIMGLLLTAALPWLLLCNMLDIHLTLPLAAMLIAILVGERAGLCSGVLLALLGGMLASQPGSAFGFDAGAMLLFVLGRLVSIFGPRARCRPEDHRRSWRGGGRRHPPGGGVAAIASKSLGTTLMDAAWVLLSALFSGLLVVGSLSIWENLFDIATPARLNELLNTSNPLLKQLMYEAPGTYQHSMNVAALAEAAAERVGADPLLASGWGLITTMWGCGGPNISRKTNRAPIFTTPWPRRRAPR